MSEGPTPASARARLIAFYLPQFYPTPENDRWWGRGFTEWTNVVQARPQFAGHYQPRLPANVGFYDLRVPEVREQQASLAREHGIEGFCYWHYWFEGRRLLDRPFQEVLDSKAPDFPFSLSWANETWTRRWHGSGETPEVLCAQTYSDADDLAHIRWLARAFADPRYIRVDGRPVFLVLKPSDLPNPRRTTDTFRNEAVRLGVGDPFLVGINAHNPPQDTRELGFDITLNFEPQLSAVPRFTEPGLKIIDYAAAVEQMRSDKREYPHVPSVVVSWDNTPRRGAHGIVFVNSTPESFRVSLTEALQTLADGPSEQRLLFLNAWNEWAEGNYLEPDMKYGLGWLEAVKSAVTGTLDADGPALPITLQRDALTADARLPTFIIIGASKGGTTSLVEYLRQHPQVFIPALKEPHFFNFLGEIPDSKSTAMLAAEARDLRTLQDYAGLYQPARSDQTALGEASTGYLPNPRAARNISRFLPDVRLIAVLRNPVERAFSFHQMTRRTGVEPTGEAFLEFIKNNPDDDAILGGFYGRALTTYLRLFKREQLNIYLFEDLVGDANSLVAHVLEHIGVDTWPIDTSDRYNVTPNKGRIPIDAHRYLVDLYRDDILLTQELIGRDLRAWLAPPGTKAT